MNIKDDKEEIKNQSISIRFTGQEFRRLYKACSRDEIKPAAFARQSIMRDLELLIKKQEVDGYSCQTI
jgi:hypothetical protein